MRYKNKAKLLFVTCLAGIVIGPYCSVLGYPLGSVQAIAGLALSIIIGVAISIYASTVVESMLLALGFSVCGTIPGVVCIAYGVPRSDWDNPVTGATMAVGAALNFLIMAVLIAGSASAVSVLKKGKS